MVLRLYVVFEKLILADFSGFWTGFWKFYCWYNFSVLFVLLSARPKSPDRLSIGLF